MRQVTTLFNAPFSSQIPAITYGGPETSPDQPSAESMKLSESLALIEFVADIFPGSGLLPADPVVRARARMINIYFDTRFFPVFWDFFLEGKPVDLLGALDTVQRLLPVTGFAVGAWSIADVGIAPFLVRVAMLLEHDIGKQSEQDGKMLIALHEPRFTRIMKYIEDAKEWPSFKATYDEVWSRLCHINWKAHSSGSECGMAGRCSRSMQGLPAASTQHLR